jgi:hypothetical protein
VAIVLVSMLCGCNPTPKVRLPEPILVTSIAACRANAGKRVTLSGTAIDFGGKGNAILSFSSDFRSNEFVIIPQLNRWPDNCRDAHVLIDGTVEWSPPEPPPIYDRNFSPAQEFINPSGLSLKDMAIRSPSDGGKLPR